MNVLKRSLAGLAAACSLVAILAGCSGDGALSPASSDKSVQSVRTESGEVQLMETGTVETPLFKHRRRDDGDGEFYAEKFIEADEGGRIVIGNKHLGRSSIEFKEGDLPEDMTISFEWAASRFLQGVFGPHGTRFNHPVSVTLSYKSADLRGVVEENIRVYYFNDRTRIWELIGGDLDMKHKTITVELSHFSRYALAWSR